MFQNSNVIPNGYSKRLFQTVIPNGYSNPPLFSSDTRSRL